MKVMRTKGWTLPRYGVGLIYAEREGGPVLLSETTWTKINGIWINTKRGAVWLMFRRAG